MLPGSYFYQDFGAARVGFALLALYNLVTLKSTTFHLISPFTMLGLYSGLPYEPSAEISNRLLEGRVQLCLLIVGVVKNNDLPLPRRNDRPA